MQFSGSTLIRAPRDRVWAFVVDPNQVGWCGPGVEAIDQLDATHYRARAKVGLGPISTRFAVNLELTEAAAPETAVIKAHGHAPGSAVEATGRMTLSGPAEGPTTMDWTADVEIMGTVASVGARFVQGAAENMIAQSFDCMRGKLEA